MSQMLKSSGAMAAATLTSRVLGMVREMVYAAFMGNTWVASAFTLAFQVPNLFRRLLGEGALTAAFIPIFKQKEVKEGEAEMWRSANAVISGLVIAAGAVTVLAVLGISLALAAGQFEDETRLMLRLLRLMFPYMLLVCLAAVFIGMANARGHFFVPALGAVLLNVIMIASVLLLAPRMGLALEQQIFGLAIGVVVAGIAQAFFQLPSLSREGYRYEWVSPWRDPTVREVVRKMLPGSIGVAAFQINVLATQCFSFWFDPTIVATFNYSVRLMELPQGMFGISLATYLLPTLAGLAAAKKFPEFRQTLSQGLSYLAFANLIAAAIALALAVPIVRLIFEHGKFGPDATQRVALSLACLAPGLLMFSMNNILARAFYALDDIKTPMKISLVCLGVEPGVCLLAGASLPGSRLGRGQHPERDFEPGAAGVCPAPQALAAGPGGRGQHAAGAGAQRHPGWRSRRRARLALGETAWPRHAHVQARDGIRARRHRCADLLAGGALAEGACRPGDNRPGFAEVPEEGMTGADKSRGLH